ncbi:transposase, partial [Microcoleus sp. FACHB-672]|uniref:transposase n=1 Tax=Microcoleus sp. FACHB-672 TaxID=2692825 RepID=UPI001688187B
MSEVDEEKIVYVDEAGFDEREYYPYGYSPKGERCHALKPGRKRERSNWISALKAGRLLAPLTFVGGCHRDLVEAWLAQSLVPHLERGDTALLRDMRYTQGNIKGIENHNETVLSRFARKNSQCLR